VCGLDWQHGGDREGQTITSITHHHQCSAANCCRCYTLHPPVTYYTRAATATPHRSYLPLFVASSPIGVTEQGSRCSCSHLMSALPQSTRTERTAVVASDNDYTSDSDSDYVDVNEMDTQVGNNEDDDDDDAEDSRDLISSPEPQSEAELDNSVSLPSMSSATAAHRTAMQSPLPAVQPSPPAASSNSLSLSTTPHPASSTTRNRPTPHPPLRQQPTRSAKDTCRPSSITEAPRTRTPPSDKRRSSRARAAHQPDAAFNSVEDGNVGHATPGGHPHAHMHLSSPK
jgi:hypothetical protein